MRHLATGCGRSSLKTANNTNGVTPVPVKAGEGSGGYFARFRPDTAPAGLEDILRAFGDDYVEIDSTYILTDVRAGNDIDIGHVTSTRLYAEDEPRAYRTTEIGKTSVYGDTITAAAPDTRMNIVLNVDTGWTGGNPTDLVPQLFVTTDGSIVVNELLGDMLVGHVHSTDDDVTLNSAARILDADGMVTVDVTGETIRLNAGVPVVGAPVPVVGGIGTPGNFLEVNSDRNGNGGLLFATDTAAPATVGIYIDEIFGDMPVGLVQTTGDVSLRTVDGSVLDGLNSNADNVRGQSIDIDANGQGATIGTSDNFLEIDSRRGTPEGAGVEAGGDDVGLEATGSIWLEETTGDLRVVLAHSYEGDITLKVRESAAQGEDFFLVHSGSARFAESNDRGPGPSRRTEPGADATAQPRGAGQRHAAAGRQCRDQRHTCCTPWGHPDRGDAWQRGSGLRHEHDPARQPERGRRGDAWQPERRRAIWHGPAHLYGPGPPLKVTGGSDVDSIQFGDSIGISGGTTLGDAGLVSSAR